MGWAEEDPAGEQVGEGVRAWRDRPPAARPPMCAEVIRPPKTVAREEGETGSSARYSRIPWLCWEGAVPVAALA